MGVKLSKEEIQQVHIKAKHIAAAKLQAWQKAERKKYLFKLEHKFWEWLSNPKRILKTFYNEAIKDLTERALAAKQIEQFDEWKRVFPDQSKQKKLEQLKILQQKRNQENNHERDRGRDR